MKIAITGASGFIGQNLVEALKNDHEVFGLSRHDISLPVEEFAKKYDGIDVFINLAGANVDTRWNDVYKEILISSRLYTTEKLIESFKLMEHQPKQLISTSAVGIYSDKMDNSEENNDYSNDFLGTLCQNWEAKAKEAEGSGVKVAITRFGIVMGKGGGALRKMMPIFKLGLGGKLGNGKQAFSWIHIEDLINAHKMLIEQGLEGTFNYTAPNPTTNGELTKVLAKALNKTSFMTVPAFMVKLLFGEGSTVLLSGQRVFPKKLQEAGFEFKYKTIEEAVNAVVKK